MEMQDLRDLMTDELKDLYSAETQIVAALPKMMQSATSPDLQKSFQMHLEQTQQPDAGRFDEFGGFIVHSGCYELLFPLRVLAVSLVSPSTSTSPVFSTSSTSRPTVSLKVRVSDSLRLETSTSSAT